MASVGKLAHKSSFEDFFSADILDSSKSSASKFMATQFEKMRENLSTAGINIKEETPTPIRSRAVKFTAKSSENSSVPEFSAPFPPPVLEKGRVPAAIISPVKKSRSRSSSPSRVRTLSADNSNKVNVLKKDAPPPPPLKDMGVNPVVSLPARPDIVRTLGTNTGSFREGDGSIAAMNTFRGIKSVNSGSFREEVHLHHDVFLATNNDSITDAVNAISRRRQGNISRYADVSEIDYTIKPETKNVRCTVPSHIVRPKSAERSRSAPRGVGVRGGGGGGVQQPPITAPSASSSTSVSDAAFTRVGVGNVAIPMLKLSGCDPSQQGGSASSQKSPKSPLNVKNVALNPELFRGGSNSSLKGLNSGSMSDLRISPTTVVVVSPQNATTTVPVKNAAPLIKQQQRKKTFDFAKPKNNGSSAQNLLVGASVSGPAKQSFSAPPATTSTYSAAAAEQYLTPAKAIAPSSSHTTAAASAHSHVPRHPHSSPQSASKVTSPGVTATYTRPLTAAEHAAAKSMSSKLNAANLAYNRAGTAEVKPFRKMSRALSQLVYNVRDSN